MGVPDAQESLISLVTAKSFANSQQIKMKWNAGTEIRVRMLDVLSWYLVCNLCSDVIPLYTLFSSVTEEENYVAQ